MHEETIAEAWSALSLLHIWQAMCTSIKMAIPYISNGNIHVSYLSVSCLLRLVQKIFRSLCNVDLKMIIVDLKSLRGNICNRSDTDKFQRTQEHL
jgi:hypothetical protein